MTPQPSTGGLRSAAAEGVREVIRHPRELAGLFALAFIVLFSYAISRPASESIFLGTYSEQDLPLAWLIVAVFMFPAVWLFNNFARRAQVLRLLIGTAVVSAAGFAAILIMLRFDVPGSVFLLYVWKDIHIVVLVESFWSIANLVFHVGTARWIYGLFCAAGSVGAVAGNLLVGPLAKAIGTANTIWVVPPLLLLLAAGASRYLKSFSPPPPKAEARVADAVRIIRESSYLGSIVALVALTQIAITLIDYLYNGAVRAAYPIEEERTQVIGWVYASINGGSFLLQLLTGPLLRGIGVGATLTALPLLLGGAVAWHLVVPIFAVMAAAKAASKAFDYSLFRAGKEILYIPLSYREKVQGKAVADMLTYRVAKGAAAALLLTITIAVTQTVILGLTLGLIVAWLVVTLRIIPRYRRRGETQQEETAPVQPP